ncbi:MAG: hypothetical protein K0S76_1677 [Herbinix sp.]|jgi:polyisoprenoid-binding protein YceI|nr:hypothetical protein [Herbinix sp.]
MKKSFLVVVALLCMASLMAAMAYTKATVTSAGSFKISNTDTALLALTAGNHGAAGYNQTNKAVSGKLVINWAKGNNGEFGMQHGSVYTWDSLFTVTNNSENTVNVTISIPDASIMQNTTKNEPNIQGNLYMKTSDDTTWYKVAGRHSGSDVTVTFVLAAGASKTIDSKFDFDLKDNIENSKFDLNIVVDAVRVVPVTP